MDPITAMLGIGLSVLGTVTSLQGANQYNKANQQSIVLQQQVEAQRKQAMELDAQRKEMEIVRSQQRARSLALTNSTSQGAAQGSGLQGGYGQIAGQSGVNMLGVQQNLGIGRNIFGLNEQISQWKIEMAKDNQTIELGKGIGALGGQVAGAAKAFGNITSPTDNRSPTPYMGQQGGVYGQLGYDV